VKHDAHEPEGVLLVDKPAGPTSHDVVRDVRRALHTRAVGHTGTLDPFATGLLVVVVGRYTRLSPYLTDDDKEYEATIALGRSTTTDDPMGETIETGDARAVSRAQVDDALATLRAQTTQRIPIFSAVRQDGERLYDRARRGDDVVAPERAVAIRSLTLLGFDDGHVAVRVVVSKGTYIRAIARDLGALVGCPAHCATLRRTRSGPYRVDDAIAARDLADRAAGALRVGPEAVPGLTPLPVDDVTRAAIATGRRFAPPAPLDDGALALAHDGGSPLAVVQREGETCRVVRGFGG